MAQMYPSKGYFKVGTHEQQLEALRESWSGKHREYNEGTKVCTRCNGKGYTRKTRTTVDNSKGEYKTVALGSGCQTCYGTGKVNK